MADELNKVTGLTEEQQKMAQERMDKGLCPVCGYAMFFCGGPTKHLQNKKAGKE